MDKSRVCVTKATKLAQQKCVKKTNLLVYEKKPDPCSDVKQSTGYVMPPIIACSGKKIRICTGADLRKMCPPKLCECPVKRSRGFLGRLFSLLGFGLKAAIAAGLVYWTYDIGLWGDSEDTEEIYLDLCEMVAPDHCDVPHHKRRKPSELCEAEISLMCVTPVQRDDQGVCVKAPSTETAVYNAKYYWNKGVVTAFDVLVHFPAYLMALYCYIMNFNKIDTEECHKKRRLAEIEN